MREVTEIITRVSCLQVKCPACGYELEGWVVDPRGIRTFCDECREELHIHRDSDIILY